MRTTTVQRPVHLLAILVIGLAAAAPGAAQQRAADAPRQFTSDDYARAEKWMSYNTTPLVANGPVRATWLPDNRLWYRNQTANGSEFVLVDAGRGTRAPAFDQGRVAAALSTAAGKTFEAARLPFTQITWSADRQSFTVGVDGKRWTCDVHERLIGVESCI